jgi:TolB-like protein
LDPSSGSPHVVRFDVFELDLQSGELRKPGSKIRLQDKPLQILTLLLEHPEEVVTREELQKRLWTDGIIADFEHNINTAVKRLREALGDDAEHPRFIETLLRHGYRFIAPVDGGAIQELPLLTTGPRAIHELPLQIRSIAVPPFDNLSHDPEQECFADGMTEELITNLGKFSALRVISRTSVMQYKGTKKPLPQIARELNVDAIVEGTVQRSKNRVHITANLLHAPTDRHLWAET